MRLVPKIGIFEEAKEFHLRIWETPSFLFLVMGTVTIVVMYVTYVFTERFGDPEIIIIGEVLITAIMLILGVLFVNGLSKMVIVNRANYDFLSLAAHQLRTPLTGVKWTLKAFLDGDFGTITPHQFTMLKRGYESNERMILLVADLLHIARIEAQHFSYDFSYEDISSLLDEVVEGLSFEAERKKVLVAFERPDTELPKVRIDKTKIIIVLQNIIDNAIKYNIPNGKVIIRLYPETDGIVISIQDTGIGIPARDHEKIFTRFFRAENVIHTKTTVGSGLGLFLTKNIIDTHGGSIWFESEINKGTSFYIKLPI